MTVQGTRVTGIHGTELLNQQVLLEDMSFPEFSPTQRIPGPLRATMFRNDESAYDIIVGMDTMQALGIDIKCSTKSITWNGITVPFRPSNYFTDTTFAFVTEDDPLDIEAAEQAGYKSTKILHSKYEKAKASHRCTTK